MSGIVSYGAYIPYWRLQRSAITSALGSGGGRGTRSVASYDEDTTSLAVEAGRVALANAPQGYSPDNAWFATATPAYLDKTNATAIHAALALPDGVGAYDVNGSVRSQVAALMGASARGSQMAFVSDVRVGLPGGQAAADRRWRSCPTCVSACPVVATRRTVAMPLQRSASARTM